MRPSLVLAAVVATLAAGLGAADATLGRPAAPAVASSAGAAAGSSPVRGAALVCPDARGVPGRQVTWVRAAAVPKAGPAAGAGLGDGGYSRLDATTLGRTTSPARLTGAYGGHELVVGKGGAAVAFSARGPVAAGLAAGQLTRSDGGLSRGLSATSCQPPGTQFSFVGGSTAVGADLTLYLANVDTVPASVDLVLLGEHGPIRAVNTQGIHVPPASRVAIDLVRLAAGSRLVATTVQVRSGRVAAGVADARRKGSLPEGVDWVPPTVGAGTHLVVPGVADGAGTRSLVVANPGTVAATAHVQLVTRQGAYVPTGLDAVAVPAGTVRAVDLTRQLAGQAGAVVLTGDRPLMASVQAVYSSADTGFADFSWTTAAPALDGPAVVPLLSVDERARRTSSLVLSAPAAGAHLTVTPLGPGGNLRSTASREVTVPAGRTTTVDVGRLLGVRDAMPAVVITPRAGSGPVYAEAVVRETGARGVLVTAIGVAGGPLTVAFPAVAADPTAPVARSGERGDPQG